MTTETQTPETPDVEPTTAETEPPVQEWSDEPEAGEEATSEESPKGTAKKLISLRLPLEDLGRARVLAEELRIGYQTLLCQIINEGLTQAEAQARIRKLSESIKGSLPSINAAEELANSPAVKAAQELLNHPTVKAAQELVSSPVVKAAEELKGSPQFKAAQDLANAPAGWARDIAATPAMQTVQALASTTTAKVIQDFAASPAFKSAESLIATVKAKAEAAPAESAELKQLTQAVADMQAALRKAGLMA